MNTNETFVEIHGHRIVSRIDDAGEYGWSHEAFALINPRRNERDEFVHDGVGESIGAFPTLAAGIAEAKRRCPPEPMPEVESVEVTEE